MYWECVCRVCSDRSSTCTAVLEFRVWTPVKGCSYLGKNISMWLMASQWQSPERLETLRHSLQSKNLYFEFCPSKKLQRLTCSRSSGICLSLPMFCHSIVLHLFIFHTFYLLFSYSIYISIICLIYHSIVLSIIHSIVLSVILIIYCSFYYSFSISYNCDKSGNFFFIKRNWKHWYFPLINLQFIVWIHSVVIFRLF